MPDEAAFDLYLLSIRRRTTATPIMSTSWSFPLLPERFLFSPFCSHLRPTGFASEFRALSEGAHDEACRVMLHIWTAGLIDSEQRKWCALTVWYSGLKSPLFSTVDETYGNKKFTDQFW